MPEIISYYGHIFVTQWMDILWIPVTLLIVHKKQRLAACSYILLCMLVLRLQIEIVQGTGFKTGFTGLLDWPLMYRGYGVYGIFNLLYLLLSYYSPWTRGIIYLAASLSIFFMAFTIASVVLII